MKEDNKEQNNIETDVDVIELLDDNGESLMFELLDEVEFEDAEYFAVCQLPSDENDSESVPTDVYILLKTKGDDGEDRLAPVEDESLIEKVFNVFKDKNGNKFAYEN
jgi:uncharacterized protein YrzB (UPF0473 family)